jgi:transcriptional regulator with XRE-family HTH domain
VKAKRLEVVLARRLREVAALRDVPLSHVADRAGIARSYFWKLLDAESSATLDMIQRIAAVLHEDPIDLLTEGAKVIFGVGPGPQAKYREGRIENPIKRPRRKSG